MKLSLSNLNQIEVAKPSYDVQSLPISVVHFGPGAFFRAHQAYYFDQLNERDPRFGICCVSMHSKTVSEALKPQDGLYLLCQLDHQTNYQVIGAIREICLASDDRDHIFQRICNEETLYITATITEKGYCLTPSGTLDLAHPDMVHDANNPFEPISFVGFVVAGLKLRFDLGLKPVVILSCDNLASNGRKLKAAILAYAGLVFPHIRPWLEAELICPNTMVDSITPATDSHLKNKVKAETGIDDLWPIQRESFVQWVIEAHDLGNGPDWTSVGVTLTNDVAAFEKAKLWLLNASHSTLAYLGILRGHRTVFQAMNDPYLKRHITALMDEDIAPLLEASKGADLMAYAKAIRQRYENQSIAHHLSQIAWDGSQKLPIRIMAPLKLAFDRGRNIERFCLTLAAWMRFVRHMVLRDTPITDPLARHLTEIGHQMVDKVEDVDAFLALDSVFPRDLTSEPLIIANIKEAYAHLLTNELAITHA